MSTKQRKHNRRFRLEHQSRICSTSKRTNDVESNHKHERDSKSPSGHGCHDIRKRADPTKRLRPAMRMRRSPNNPNSPRSLRACPQHLPANTRTNKNTTPPAPCGNVRNGRADHTLSRLVHTHFSRPDKSYKSRPATAIKFQFLSLTSNFASSCELGVRRKKSARTTLVCVGMRWSEDVGGAQSTETIWHHIVIVKP